MSQGGKVKKSRKDSQLIIRIAQAERDAFVALCDELDTSAAREIRRFIRDFTLSHTQSEEDEPLQDNPVLDDIKKEPNSWQKLQKSKPSKKK